jgi:putative Mg2+ transporter-C (MgtC) family protein
MGDLHPHLVSHLSRELFLELALAVVLGGLVGFEREWRGKAAGLRTNILICMAAVLFTEISQRSSLAGGDPGRIAAQILTGVGFLGAGTIIHNKGGVSGLTSAATIWMMTAIGVTLGWGAYIDAIAATLLVLVVLGGLQWIEDWIRAHRPTPREATE